MEIAPGVYSMGNWRGGRVHAFLLDDGHELTLVDTLFETDARVILAEIKAIGRSPVDVKRIVLTHAHRSHLGGLAALKRITRAPVCAHEWEVGIITGARKAERVHLLPMRPYRTFPLQVGLNLHLDRHAYAPVDVHIADGETLGPLVVVGTPGHTPGHLSFYWPERRLMITGDIVATWPVLEPGWPAFNLDARRHSESLRHMAEFKPSLLAVGHGDPVRDIGTEHLHELVETADKWAAR